MLSIGRQFWLLVLSLTLFAAATARAAGESAAYRGGPARTGVVAAQGPIETPRELWRVPVEYASGSATVAGDVAVIGDKAHLRSVDRLTGEVKWETAWPSQFSTPAVSDGVIVIGGGAACACPDEGEGLGAFDLETGKQLWTYKPGGVPVDGLGPNLFESSPAIVDGVVFTGESGNGDLHALDLQTGEVKWVFETHGGTFASPSVADGIVYIGSDGSKADPTDTTPVAFYAVDAETGTERWHVDFDAGFSMLAAAPIVAGTVYLAQNNFERMESLLVALDALTGEERWRTSVPVAAASSPFATETLVGLPGQFDGVLNAYNAKTGELVWSADLEGRSATSPTVASDIVYATNNDRVLFAFDLSTGNELWRYQTNLGTGEIALISPAVADGVVYLRAEDVLLAIGT
jgi:outer membrane protein assembly factor BamB